MNIRTLLISTALFVFSASAFAQQDNCDIYMCDLFFSYNVSNMKTDSSFELQFIGFKTPSYTLGPKTMVFNAGYKYFAPQTGLQFATMRVYRIIDNKRETRPYCEVNVPQNVRRVGDKYQFGSPPPSAKTTDTKRCTITNIDYEPTFAKAWIELHIAD